MAHELAGKRGWLWDIFPGTFDEKGEFQVLDRWYNDWPLDIVNSFIFFLAGIFLEEDVQFKITVEE